MSEYYKFVAIRIFVDLDGIRRFGFFILYVVAGKIIQIIIFFLFRFLFLGQVLGA